MKQQLATDQLDFSRRHKANSMKALLVANLLSMVTAISVIGLKSVGLAYIAVSGLLMSVVCYLCWMRSVLLNVETFRQLAARWFVCMGILCCSLLGDFFLANVNPLHSSEWSRLWDSGVFGFGATVVSSISCFFLFTATAVRMALIKKEKGRSEMHRPTNSRSDD